MVKAIFNNALDKQKWKQWTPFILWSIFFYGMYLRIKKLSWHKLWVDEHWQLTPMKGSFKELLELLPLREFCSYLSGDYYLIYPFFKYFGYNKWGLAIPHIIITIIGFYLFYRICRMYLKTSTGYIISFLIFSFNATLIHHATEIRVYAVLPTLAMASFLLIYNLLLYGDKIRGIKIWALDILLIIIILFHVYGVLMVFFPLVYSLWDHRGKENFKANLKFLIKHFLIIGIITAPIWLYSSVFGQHLTLAGVTRDVDFLYQFIPNPAENMIGFLKGVFGNLVGYRLFYVFLLGGAGLLFVPYSISEKIRQIVFVMVLVFFPISLIFISDVHNNYWFIQRQFIWIIPFFILFLGWLWDTMISWRYENWNRLQN